MISIRNIEKLLKDHPEIPDQEKILAQARKMADNNILSGGSLDQLFGSRAKELARELEKDIEHIQMGLEDIRQATGQTPSMG